MKNQIEVSIVPQVEAPTLDSVMNHWAARVSVYP